MTPTLSLIRLMIVRKSLKRVIHHLREIKSETVDLGIEDQGI